MKRNDLIILLLFLLGAFLFLNSQKQSSISSVTKVKSNKTYSEKNSKAAKKSTLETKENSLRKNLQPIPKSYSQDFNNRVKYLINCLNFESCNEFINTDKQREYNFFVSEKIKSELDNLRQYMIKNRLSPDETTINFVMQALDQPENLITEAAFDFILLFPVRREIFNKVSSTLNISVDSLIYEKGLDIFSNYYKNDEYKKEISDFLLDKVMNGNISASTEVSRNILPFLNSKNINEFSTTLQNLSKDSKKYRYLKSYVDEYKRLNFGS